MKKYLNLSSKKLPYSEVELTAEISAEVLNTFKEKALKKIALGAEMPGFRKGKVPEEVLQKKLGDMTILSEAAELAIEDAYPEIIEDSKQNIIGNPSIKITKLAPGNPLEFSIIATIFPEFNLPEYKKIAIEEAKKGADTAVTEKEIDEVVLEIRKQHAHVALHKKIGSENHDHAPIEEKDLLPLTDELTKEFGNFEGISDFRKKISENLEHEKKLRAKEKIRMSIIEKIVDATTVDTPRILIENELEKMVAQFKDDVAKTGLSYDNYLTTVKKTEQDLRNEWRPTAEKKAKAQLLLGRIAEKEKLAPDKDKLESETKKIIEEYKDANPERVKMYVATMLLNEKVLEFLENLNQAK